MSYLIQRDYDRLILDAELQQYLNTDKGIQSMAERSAVGKVKAYLKQKYYTDWEFTDTSVYSATKNYSPLNGTYPGRVILDFAAYIPANTYNIGDLVSNGVNQYYCKANGTTGTFDATKFYLLGVQYDIWYLKTPAPLFDLKGGSYKVGNLVFWNGKMCSALKTTALITEIDRLDPLFDQNIPQANIFPDDPNQGANFWNSQSYNIKGIAPGIPLSNWTAWIAGTYSISDTRTYNGILYISQVNNNTSIPGSDLNWFPIVWVQGDNRDQLILDVLLKLVIWDLSSRIMVDESPEIRERDKEYAYKLLDQLRHGDITPDQLIRFEDDGGLSVAFGGVTKTVNVW